MLTGSATMHATRAALETLWELHDTPIEEQVVGVLPLSVVGVARVVAIIFRVVDAARGFF